MIGLAFSVPGPPQSKQRARTFQDPRTKKMVSKTPAATVHFESLVALCAQQTGKTLPSGRYVAEIDFFLQRPKRLGQRDPDPQWCEKRPDVDNLVKAILDGLRRVLVDDAQVVHVDARKLYCGLHEAARTEVVLVQAAAKPTPRGTRHS